MDAIEARMAEIDRSIERKKEVSTSGREIKLGERERERERERNVEI
jgi:hypothetical protein